MPKPTESILAWIHGLAPTDELTVRMAMVMTNEWCEQDPAWRLRIEQLRPGLVKSDSDETAYADRARAMAKDMDAALRSMQKQPADTVDR